MTPRKKRRDRRNPTRIKPLYKTRPIMTRMHHCSTSYEAHCDAMSEENITKKLHKLKKTEIQNNKMADKATNAAKLEMHNQMKHMYSRSRKKHEGTNGRTILKTRSRN
jgi:hypothetical protein